MPLGRPPDFVAKDVASNGTALVTIGICPSDTLLAWTTAEVEHL